MTASITQLAAQLLSTHPAQSVVLALLGLAVVQAWARQSESDWRNR
jgi:hypothetical protein